MHTRLFICNTTILKPLAAYGILGEAQGEVKQESPSLALALDAAKLCKNRRTQGLTAE